MKSQRKIATASLGLFFLVTVPAIAQETKAEERETKNEITVFGGLSFTEASGGAEWPFGAGNFPSMPGFPMFPGFPGRFPDATTRGEGSLDSSALFGARYSRKLKDRLAMEADLSIAPSHDLELGGEFCLEGYGCYGDGRQLGGRFGQGFGKRELTACHYGGGLAYDLTGGDVRPLLLVGAGGVTWDGASETDFVFRFGAGLKVLFGGLGLRIDVTDHLVVDHFLSGDSEHDLHATAGFLVSF
jgi:hypothetical protein